jgi:hypothetical protein
MGHLFTTDTEIIKTNFNLLDLHAPRLKIQPA